MATNQNEYLVWGWSSQQLVGLTTGPVGYAQPATIPASGAVSAASQVSAGLPSPAGAENVQGENATSQTAQILTNPGYANGNGTILGPIAVTALATVGTTVAYQNPSGLAAIVTIAAGTVTLIQTAPLVAGAAGTYVSVSVGETSSECQVTVPGGGFIKVTFTGTPTWTWVTTN